MAELAIGTDIRLKNGRNCRVKRELGRGGQGIVYVVEYAGKDYALKWYTQQYSDAFYNNLSKNVNNGSPSANFLWPLAITERQMGSFGYIMELRPQSYEDMGQFILCKARFASVRAQLNACLQVSEAFQKLHIRGLSYQDMNDGNFFINPTTGDVLICDNDNVAPDGSNMGILGKAGYMAPEIVEGLSMPNKYSDYYSMAVCLFILIYMNRPFEGAYYLGCPCDNNPEMARKLFGRNSVFIMDPTNASNRPVPSVHNNVLRRWGLYPGLLAQAFIKTFGRDAMLHPDRRLIDKQWHNILLQVRSMYVRCPNDCGHESFFDTSHPERACIYCYRPAHYYPTLKVGRFDIPLLPGQTIYDCQVSDTKNLDAVAGEVQMRGGEIGILNRSTSQWTVTTPDGKGKVVSPGSGFPARKGFSIRFGNTGESGVIN